MKDENTKVTFTKTVKESLLAIKTKKCCKKSMENADKFLMDNAIIDRVGFTCPECRNAFLRQVFLKCGSVNSPDKSNHFELKFKNEMNADEMCILLREMDFSPKMSQRRGLYIVYFKDGDTIFDILSVMGAQKYAFELVNTQIEKNIRNNVNRVNNCEMANMQKSALASARVTDAIKLLEQEGMLETLGEKLYYTAILRRDNPDLSLLELAKIHEPPITKSCVNHRLDKIVKAAFKG